MQPPSRSRSPWSLAICAIIALGCSAGDEGLHVSVQTDLAPGIDFDAVRTSLDEGTPAEVFVHADDRFGEPHHVASFTQVDHGRRHVTVSLLRGTFVVTTRDVVFPFSGSYVVNVVVTRNCATIRCGPTESCIDAGCVPRTCVTGREPTCPPSTCTRDLDCRAVTECGEARCLAGVCAELPHPERCAAGELCVIEVGCVPPPFDAGVAGDARVESPCAGRPAGTPCRLPVADCDATEVCDGVSDSCPADAFLSGAVCRPSMGDCDLPEACPGDSPTCPYDAVVPSGTLCREGIGPCSATEFCDGVDAGCPPDGSAPDGAPCELQCGRETCSGGSCRGGETCPASWTCCEDTACTACGCSGCK